MDRETKINNYLVESFGRTFENLTPALMCTVESTIHYQKYSFYRACGRLKDSVKNVLFGWMSNG